MSKWDDFIGELRKNAGNLAEDAWKEYTNQVVDRLAEFAKQSKDKLLQWTEMRKNGELTEEEFEDLVKGLGDLGEVKALTQAGLTAAQLQRLRDQTIDLVAKTALKVLLA